MDFVRSPIKDSDRSPIHSQNVSVRTPPDHRSGPPRQFEQIPRPRLVRSVAHPQATSRPYSSMLMGGEYLPGYLSGETEIGRIDLAQPHQM